jgi:tRNA(Arg) A34 adenosine deaminase TadA
MLLSTENVRRGERPFACIIVDEKNKIVVE